VVNWIEEWLTGRIQRVMTGGSYSSEATVDSSAPQGSVLGPCLSIFLEDLEVEVELTELGTIIVKFADETKGLQEIESEEDRYKMQRELDMLVKRPDECGTVFNNEKCKVIHVGRRNPQYDYYMRGHKLPTKEEKNVGVTVTNNLKPST
jgi:ribonuclease P/MRP protein subunit RPP40